MDRTLVILKPDAIARGLVGEVISRLERKGLTLVGCKMVQLTEAIMKEHYAHLADKPFYPRIARFMSSLPVIVQCWQGIDAVRVVREIAGPTNGRDARPGTIRGDYSVSIQCNLLHASDTASAAAIEIERFFSPDEIHGFRHPLEALRYSVEELPYLEGS
jgi:nucleoside-diphosphate kinase